MVTVKVHSAQLTNEQVLSEAVRSWVEVVLPGDAAAVDCAAGVARAAYREGATVSDACERARSLVESWTRHPAYRGRLASARRVRLAS